MKQSDEQVFQTIGRQAAIQTIDFIPIHQYKRQSSKLSKKADQAVSWKFNALGIQYPTSKSANYNNTKNISFQEDECYTNQQNDNQDNDEYQESCFCEYYQNCEETYKKKSNFGTSWIGKKQYFASTFINPSKIEKNNIPYFSPKTPFSNEQPLQTKDITFDSQFESGNLQCAFKVSQFQYDLLLQNDLNTKGNTQWFYFRIINLPKNRPIKINIVNLRKPDSLFNYGLLPCVYSLEEDKRTKKGWFRGGKHVRYFKNSHPVQNSKRYYFTLSFTVSTIYQKDILCVAHSYPYTNRDLNLYLQSIRKIRYKSELIQCETLVNTVGKNKIEVLTIQQNNKIKGKPIIFIMARQHPGETPSSFVCQGLIDFLLSKDKESEYLRKNYQIKVIPMVNPDGVAAGNYRTNLSGVDLNRRWDGGNKTKNMHQSVYVKKYLSQLAKTAEIAFILDIHGHSRKFYSFFYGNPSQSNPIEPRIYPLLCAKLGPNLIRFEDSTFASQQFKRNTARIQLGLSYKTPNIFTYQVSFFGYIGKDKQKRHFTIDGLRELGQILGKSLYQYERGKELFDRTPENKEIALFKKCINELKNNKTMITLGQRQNSGSQSSPSECELKQNDEQRLEQNEQYLNNKTPSKVKIVKKIVKSQSPVKEVCKSSRQMQVLDLAQVNSAFPSNIIALIPKSFITKLKKPILVNASVQTEDSPIIKIYQSCKKQDESSLHPQSSLQLSTLETTTSYEKKSSQMMRSAILNRPKTTEFNIQSTQFIPLGIRSQRKSRQMNLRQQRSSTKKASSVAKSYKTQDKQTQTALSFGKSTSNTSSNLKIRLQKESHLLESKNIDPSFSTMQYKKGNFESFFPSKTLSKSIYEHIKYRRNNGA